jgi:hypothetical protein
LLVGAGAAVTASMRTPPSVFPRDWLGVPLGPLALVGEHLPAACADVLERFIQWQVFCGLSRYGIPLGEVERLEPDAAVLVTGERIAADAVIFATGVLDDRGVPRYPAGAPTDPTTPRLYFAGVQVALSGSIRVSARHGRRIAKAVAADNRQPA